MEIRSAGNKLEDLLLTGTQEEFGELIETVQKAIDNPYMYALIKLDTEQRHMILKAKINVD